MTRLVSHSSEWAIPVGGAKVIGGVVKQGAWLVGGVIWGEADKGRGWWAEFWIPGG